jgi:hypothetical protein
MEKLLTGRGGNGGSDRDFSARSGTPVAELERTVVGVAWEALRHFGVEGGMEDGAHPHVGKNLKRSSLPA